jgi:hypothetical protein
MSSKAIQTNDQFEGTLRKFGVGSWGFKVEAIYRPIFNKPDRVEECEPDINRIRQKKLIFYNEDKMEDAYREYCHWLIRKQLGLSDDRGKIFRGVPEDH